MRSKIAAGAAAVIAEIKKASPSKGVLRADFRPGRRSPARYARARRRLPVRAHRPRTSSRARPSTCSRRARPASLPVLRKDFIVDPYQVYEARAMGADCILLIVAALGTYQPRLHATLAALGRATSAWRCWSRCTTPRELDLALRLDTPLIGINNRNLRSFEVVARDDPRPAAAHSVRPHRGHRERHPDAGRRGPHALPRRASPFSSAKPSCARPTPAPNCPASSPRLRRPAGHI
ncbi:MAG: hypothetical protein MZW92_80660 [Comamonadaceae bacterium]|nr:hypothetical protein [Comamonadaceae bacterium]